METPGFYKRHKRWLLPLIILLVAVVAMIGLVSLRQPPPTKEPEAESALVQVQELDMGPLQLTVRSQGLVEPKYRTELVAQVSGEVVELSEAFVRGGMVEKGELLARIDPTNYEVHLENARAGLASAEAALEQEQAQGEVARVEWEDVKDTPVPALGLRKPQLAQARAEVTAARAALKQARKDLERTRIVAPYDALIAAREVSLGTFVNVGGMIGEVLDISRAQIRLPVANSEIQYLPGNGVGATVTLTGDIDGRPHTWQAEIVRAEGVVDDQTRMRYLVAEVGDPYYQSENAPEGEVSLAYGSYVVARIEGRELTSAASVPRYLIKDGTLPLYRDGELALVPVEVLRNVGGQTIVTGGVATGDLLVTTALDYPVEGMALERMDEQNQQDPQPAPADEPAGAESGELAAEGI